MCQDLDALLGGPGRFKSAMMVGLERYGASFISDELLVGLTWLAPGTFYPQGFYSDLMILHSAICYRALSDQLVKD